MPKRVKILFSLILVALICATDVTAQYKGYKPIADLDAFKKKFAVESAKVLSITSDFTQEKTLMALTEKIISSGKFWFKRNNRVRIEYIKPFAYLMIMSGDKMLVRDNDKENKINVKSNKLFQQVNRIMIDCVQGTILDSKDFTSKVFEDDKDYLLEMTPASKSLREFFQTILLTVDKSDYSVKSIEMNEPAGDKTIISFKNKKLNEQVADAVFAL
ncbi:MAG TPA: outer membrane lipoprotein carrier protein LolA [Chryseolinea sp.]|nr:outer membrane lipoprotein carrier protein LolA [Chryseolinea sp.]